MAVFFIQRLIVPHPKMQIGPVMLGPYLAASLIGFAAGTAISVLLLVFTVRAARLPGTGLANILFSGCSLVWNLGGLAHTIAITWGAPEHGRAALVLLAVQFTGAAAWPISLLAIWSPLATLTWQKAGCKTLQILSVVSCAGILIPLWLGVFEGIRFETLLILKESTAYNGAILLTLGIALCRDHLVSRAMRLPSLAMLVGVFGATLAVLIQQLFPSHPVLCSILRVASEQITLFIVLGAFFLLARFRFSDVFIRYCMRMLLVALTAAAFSLVDAGVVRLHLGSHATFHEAARFMIETLAAGMLLFLFTFADRRIVACADRWIFQAPDYRMLVRQLSELLMQLRREPEIAAAVENFARQTLDLKDVRLMAVERLPVPSWRDAIVEGEIVELDSRTTSDRRLELAAVELLLPIRSAGRVSHALAVAPGSVRRGLVTQEVEYLRSVAAQFGQRLDALLLEEQRIALQSREAVLRQQITEAELRALRSQINPHFLFNSLNSIANLVVTNPDQAETMTLRLARVFRHVLANSARPLISLHEEIEFLQTYLQIEEARFGSRLIVKFEVDPAVAMAHIPSLILQPIVENALKHGLGPKPGQGHLWITAQDDNNRVRLRVEDDGVGSISGLSRKSNGAETLPLPDCGAKSGNGARSNGVGLANVAQRLHALYQDQGEMILEAPATGGTRVTIFIPRENGAVA
jgi:two-component system, LytTR family, sensor kinase